MLRRKLILLALIVGVISGCSHNCLKRASDADYGYVYAKGLVSLDHSASKNLHNIEEDERNCYTDDYRNFSIGYRYNRFDVTELAIKSVYFDKNKTTFLGFKSCYPFKLFSNIKLVPKLSFFEIDKRITKDFGFISIGMDLRYKNSENLILKCGLHKNSIEKEGSGCYFVGINYNISSKLNIDMDLSYLETRYDFYREKKSDDLEGSSCWLLEYDLGYDIDEYIKVNGFGSISTFDDKEDNLLLHLGGAFTYNLTDSFSTDLGYFHDYFYKKSDDYDSKINLDSVKLGMVWRFY